MVSVFSVVFFGIVLGVSLLVLTGVYNSLLSIKKQVDENWRNLEYFLKQREEFLPHFILLLRDVAPREKVLLDKVDEIQVRFKSALALDDKIKIANELSNVLSSLFLMNGAYPELKKNLKYKEFRQKLLEVEGHLASRQEHFNYTITVYNQRSQQFPDIIFAQTLGFPELDYIKVYEDDLEVTDLNFRLAA